MVKGWRQVANVACACSESNVPDSMSSGRGEDGDCMYLVRALKSRERAPSELEGESCVTMGNNYPPVGQVLMAMACSQDSPQAEQKEARLLRYLACQHVHIYTLVARDYHQ